MSRSSPAARVPLREQHAQATRERILDAALSLLERGVAELSLRAVAVEAQIAERTLYRYFASREELAAALTPPIRARTSEPLPETFDELPDYARRLFARFEQNAQLVIGMVTSPGLRPDLQKTRSRNLEQLRALVDRAFPNAAPAERAAATASLRVLLSGAGWAYLRASCGLPEEEVVAQACFTIEAVAARLRAGPRR